MTSYAYTLRSEHGVYSASFYRPEGKRQLESDYAPSAADEQAIRLEKGYDHGRCQSTL